MEKYAYADTAEAVLVATGEKELNVTDEIHTLSVTLMVTQQTVCSNPVFSLEQGTYSISENLSVVLTSDSVGAEIRYTLDNSTPNENSTLYTQPITFTGVNTYLIKAIAYKDGLKKSSIVKALYKIIQEEIVNPVVFAPLSGQYQVEEFTGVILTSTTENTTIRYTTDGSDPDENSAVFSQAIPLAAAGSYVVKAIAYKEGGTVLHSSVSSANYTIVNKSLDNVIQPQIADSAESPLTVDSVFSITTETEGAVIKYTVDGSDPNTLSEIYTNPFTLNAGTITIKAIAYKDGLNPSSIISKEYVITDINIPDVENPVITASNTSPYTVLTKFTVTTGTENALIRYTIDGSIPTIESTLYTAPFTLQAGNKTIRVIAYKDGLNPSDVVTGLYDITVEIQKVSNPVITASNGSPYLISTNFSITSETAGAVIKYTIDGTIPTEASATYSAAFNLSLGTKTIKAIGFKEGYNSSDIISAEFVISNSSLPDAATPVITASNASPYLVSTKFTISSATAGSIIRYTTDGSTPNESSEVYATGFSLQSGTKTIKAIAYKEGYNPSLIGSAEYIIEEEEIKVSSPTISVSGTAPYSAEAEISITSLTAGADVYYTTNGDEPSKLSTKYTVPFKLTDGDYLIKSIACKTGMLDSDLSSKSVTIITPYDGVIIYVKTASAPSIWVWETSGTGIECTKAMGFTWDAQPTMVAATGMNDNAGWFKFEIPSANVSGGTISFILNKGSTIASTKTATFWYDNGTYSDTDPTTPIGPVKPVITVTPAGGNVKGTTSVTITISSVEPITAKSAIINSIPLTFTNNGVTFTVSAYINDKTSKSLSVSATNSAGTTEVTYTFDRDDTTIVPDSVFSWDNANVYFVITDRFKNGNEANDESYGRKKDYGSVELNTGTFHGGDIAGLTAQLDANYFTDLGVNAIWITAPYEQVHGWCGGGSSTKNNTKTFPHYAYHGYYPQDYTMMDKNMGTVEEFRAFVNKAHELNIRVVVDIVMNHTGYNTLLDMEQYNFGGFTAGNNSTWTPADGKWDGVWQAVNWETTNWGNWWGANWIAAGLPTYTDRPKEGQPGYSDINSSLDGLPDFKTETTSAVGVPPFLTTKWNSETSGYDNWIIPAAKTLRTNLNVAPAEYTTKWLSAWIEEFGIDGFRVDTAKHVEMNRWSALKTSGVAALKKWRLNNPTAPGAQWTDDFWMTGEVWNHGVTKSNYFNDGKFDSIINFTFPKTGDLGSIGSTWQTYANSINSDAAFNVLSYVNSHDHKQHYGWYQTNNNIGTTLLLSPGGVQIYYGDENSRPLGPEMSDLNQSTRSDYQWGANATQLTHWQKLGKFRRDNVAVGAGSQTDLSNNTYGRIYSKNGITNKVVIKINGTGSSDVNVAGVFADGTNVRNAYDGVTGVVSGGKVNFTFNNSVILVEEVK